MKKSGTLQTILFLMGSFTFAFLLGEMVHEWGHFLAHKYFGVEGISIHLDPFGGSRILGLTSLPMQEMGITTAAGPGLNLLAGLLVTGLFWRYTRPILLPLILWGPIALIQEGVNLSLGLLSPGSDAQWLAAWGVPESILIIMGVVFILAGPGLISWLLHLVGVVDDKSFQGRFVILFFGLGFLIILRALVSLFQSPAAALENAVPLVFALILALLITSLQGIWGSIREDKQVSVDMPTWSTSIVALGLGLGILFTQIILP